jgi:hypothetical protein
MAPRTVAELLEIVEYDNPATTGFRIRFTDWDETRSELVSRLAQRVAKRSLEPAQGGFDSWAQRYNGGPEHDQVTR